MYEIINNYRIFPRIFLVCFTLATGASIQWYLEFPIVYVVECNTTLLTGLMDRGISLKDAEVVACGPADVIGRPTGYTALIATLVGACGMVFSFYANSGSVGARQK